MGRFKFRSMCFEKKNLLGEKSKYVDRRMTAKCALMGCEDVDSVDLIPL
jgi:hypothetical protein